MDKGVVTTPRARPALSGRAGSLFFAPAYDRPDAPIAPVTIVTPITTPTTAAPISVAETTLPVVVQSRR
jgi:hypothetical protein